ncbi:MAG TPA: hypothetical protein PLJ38_10740, partial [bacterium]|nr:hypothetical protein [bacterium]
MNAKKTIEKEKFVYPNTRFNVKQFEKHIEKTAPKKMCLLYSDIENANIDEFLDALKKKINVPENNVFVYSGAELDIPQFINDYSTQPLFSERRLFVIKEINKCQQKRNKNFCEKFYEVLEENIEDTYLFIVNERLSEKKITEFLKSIIIRVFTFLLREQSVEQWIMDYVQKNNREIEYSAVRKLMVLCNERIGLIKNELTKIFLYDLQGKNITEELINKVIQSYDEKNIFKFIDALLNKDYDKSIIFYRQLLNQKENNITIIIFNITERLNKLIYFIE